MHEAYDILTNVFDCTVNGGGYSGLAPDEFCANPREPDIDLIKRSCPHRVITGSINSKEDDAGWYRSMCESPVWAEDERFRNCTEWQSWR